MMRRQVTSLLFALAAALIFYSLRSPDAGAQTTNLQQAINMTFRDPAKAEALLKSIDRPIAKAFLAYIYFLRTDPDGKNLTQAQAFMNDAVSDAARLGTSTSLRHGAADLNNLTTLLTDLRYVAVAEPQLDFYLPCALLTKHPNEALAALYPAANRPDESLPEICPSSESPSITAIPAVAEFVSLLSAVNLRQPACQRNGRMWPKTWVNFIDRVVSVSPEALLNDGDRILPSSEAARQAIQVWSALNLKNYRHMRKLRVARDTALIALSAEYRNRHGMRDKDAVEAAGRALDMLRLIYVQYDENLLRLANDPLQSYIVAQPRSYDELSNAWDQAQLPSERIYFALNRAILDRHGDYRWYVDRLVGTANINRFDLQDPPLAVAVDDSQTLQTLLDSGFQIEAVNVYGETALFAAIRENNLQSARLLVDYGANINHRSNVAGDDRVCDNLGVTPLMVAAEMGDAGMIDLLLKAGTHTGDVDSNGQGIAHYLSRNKKLDKPAKQAFLERLGPVAQQ